MPAASRPQEEPLAEPTPAAEAPQKAPGAWSAEGKTLAETETASFEKGRENFGAEKQEMDARVEETAEEFTKANNSWWQKTKAAFSKAKSWVKNEEAIKKLDAQVLAAKEAYAKEAEEAKEEARREKYVVDRKEIISEREAQKARLKDKPSEKMLSDFYAYEDRIGQQDEFGKIGDVRFNEDTGELRVIYAGNNGSLKKFPSGLTLRVMPGGKIETLEGAFVIKKPSTPELKVVPPPDESVDIDVSDLEGEEAAAEEEEEPILLTEEMKKPTSAAAPVEATPTTMSERVDAAMAAEDAEEAGDEEPVLLTQEMRKPDAKAEKERMRNDPRFKGLVEEKSLAYLKAKDASWFRKNYNGEVSPSGHLIDAKGKETNFLPSQNISIGIAQVEKEAEEAYLRGDTTTWPTKWAQENKPQMPSQPVEEHMVIEETPAGEAAEEKPQATPAETPVEKVEKQETPFEKLENGMEKAAAKALEAPEATESPKTYGAKINRLSVQKVLQFFIKAGVLSSTEAEAVRVRLETDSEGFKTLRKKLSETVKNSKIEKP